jgi:hypothetical protein
MVLCSPLVKKDFIIKNIIPKRQSTEKINYSSREYQHGKQFAGTNSKLDK